MLSICQSTFMPLEYPDSGTNPSRLTILDSELDWERSSESEWQFSSESEWQFDSESESDSDPEASSSSVVGLVEWSVVLKSLEKEGEKTNCGERLILLANLLWGWTVV